MKNQNIAYENLWNVMKVMDITESWVLMIVKNWDNKNEFNTLLEIKIRLRNKLLNNVNIKLGNKIFVRWIQQSMKGIICLDKTSVFQ